MTWDRSRRWKLEHWHIHRARVRIRFAASRPTIAEIAAVRKAFPQLADVAPRDLRERLDAAAELDLGVVGLLEGRWLARDAAEVGLAAIVEQQVEIGYTIIDVTDEVPVAHIIDDEAEHERTVQEMIAAGVPVVTSIAE